MVDGVVNDWSIAGGDASNGEEDERGKEADIDHAPRQV